MASIIEQCQVAPHSSCGDKLTLPLTYFDIVWLTLHRIRRILFYNLPISKLDFIENIIPSLKNSLSLALKHYTPLAGNIACPLDSSDNYPELRYVIGDSVAVTFAESDMDFDYLVGNHPRNAKDFYLCVPQLAEPKDAPGVQLAPVLAIQVTLFPNRGISIGFTNHHVVCDGNSMVKFIRAWALLNKYDGNEEKFLVDHHEFIPFYDRSVVKDPYKQMDLIWDELKKYKEMRDIIVTPLDNIVQGTFVIGQDDIQKLKSLILSRRPSLNHVTSFTVTCGYIWTCLIKSEDVIKSDQLIDKNIMEYFGCAVDCRARLNPPLPSSYFGNCIVGYMAKTRHIDLVGNEGFTIAVESIGETIYKRNMDKEYMLTGEWMKEAFAADMQRLLSIAGSPKFDLYMADFGWGKSEKLECISLDNDSGLTMSLSKTKDSNGDLEIGLSLPKNRMNAFSAIFTQGLSFLQ